MLDLNVWNSCDNSPPKKRGKYLLLCGRKPTIGGWLNLQIRINEWNGRAWILDGEEICIKWKYIKKEDLDKYSI